MQLRRYQHKHKILLVANEETAQYIECNNLLYHARWMLPITTNTIQYEIVDVIEIGKEEYDNIFQTIEDGKDVIIEPETPVEELPEELPNDVTVEYVKSVKLSEMSGRCNQTIVNGFDILLDDNKIYHFSLTTQDQLNLISLSALIESGVTQIPYHADGELCKFYSVKDISAIIETATQYKTYHVSYFNSLKAYIESLTVIDEIKNISYGMDIPVDYQSDVLKLLNKQLNEGKK